jgi:hypothetical protein
MSMNTGRWSELSADHEVKYTGNGSSLVTAISKSYGVAEGLYGFVVGGSGPKITQELQSAQPRKFSTSRGQPRVPIHVFGVKVAGHYDRQPPPKQAVGPIVSVGG